MFLAFTIPVLEHKLSEEEHSQIVQTIEMFEAITQTQPADYQSLEILKEAYQKIGRHEESLRTSRKLAEVYFNVGSYSNALQECEAILVKEPNAPASFGRGDRQDHRERFIDQYPFGPQRAAQTREPAGPGR